MDKNIKKQGLRAKKKQKRKPKYDSISHTTGDIGFNISRFNQAMGTANLSDMVSPGGPSGGATDGGGLAEAKRYVRRYYIRPQNIFCSNKAEVLKALVDVGNNNCSVYTLNNLGDVKDVSKLMNSDIIYYYDDGVLYDKNRVKVMDYNLAIKKEENRKHFANVEKAPEKVVKDEYEDRLTVHTKLEETKELILENAFDLDFEPVDAYGKPLTEAKEESCCICGEPLEAYGNNPEPFMTSLNGACCDACSQKFVIPARLAADKED